MSRIYIDITFGFLCKIGLPHKWNRAENKASFFDKKGIMHDLDSTPYRLCRRCWKLEDCK